LGGALSLFLGISLSMVFEVIELIIDVILNVCLLCFVSKKSREMSPGHYPPIYRRPGSLTRKPNNKA